MAISTSTLIVTGLILAFLAQVLIFRRAMIRQKTPEALACLIVPLYCVFYARRHGIRSRSFAVVFCLGVIMILTGMGISAFAA